ncbi:MAG: STAS domain-containing protein [Eubacterium sp.]|nr:STAS domain-containing protein [Eubacterium sp.]
MLEIKKKTNGKEMIIGLAGSLDTTTSNDLKVVIQSELSNIETLIFDIIDLDYISSAGLRVMLLAQKIMNKQGKMIVKNVSSKIMEIFEVTGFADALTIE